jgi:hypothetical protein
MSWPGSALALAGNMAMERVWVKGVVDGSHVRLECRQTVFKLEMIRPWVLHVPRRQNRSLQAALSSAMPRVFTDIRVLRCGMPVRQRLETVKKIACEPSQALEKLSSISTVGGRRKSLSCRVVSSTKFAALVA